MVVPNKEGVVIPPVKTGHTGGEMSSEHQETGNSEEEQVTRPLTHSQLCWKIMIWIISLVIIVVNVAVDIITLILYYDSDQHVFFTLTLIFLAIPPLVIGVASLIWLWDEDRRGERENSRAENNQVTVTTFCLHVALLGLAYRYGRLIMKASFLREQSKLVQSWERDAHFLMFIQTILHCCSQLAVQLYIVGDDSEDSNYILTTIFCAGVNFIAIIWALFIYTLYDMFKGSHIKVTSKFVIFGWHLCIIMSRILALAFFSVAFHAFVFIPFGIHWLMWSVLLFFISAFLSTNFCSDLTTDKKRLYLELPFDVVIGFMLLFFYFNTKKGNTRHVVIPYHVLTLVETIVLSVTFYVEKPNKWYSLMILCLSILLYLIGSTLMLLYYLMLHPKTKEYLTTWRLSPPVQDHSGSTARINAVRQESNDS